MDMNIIKFKPNFLFMPKGEKIAYDPLWKGPMETIRSPTDRIWLITFIVYLLIFFSVGIFSKYQVSELIRHIISCALYVYLLLFIAYTPVLGFSAGSLNRYVVPEDSHSRACGVDADVVNTPYLFFLNPKECLDIFDCHSTKICVSKCPTENFIISRSETLEQVKAKLICDIDVNTTLIRSFDQLDQLVNLERCAKWYLVSDVSSKYCLPTKVWEGHEDETLNAQQLNETRKMIEALKSVWTEFRENTSIAM